MKQLNVRFKINLLELIQFIFLQQYYTVTGNNF
jgi:hypothetical protein